MTSPLVPPDVDLRDFQFMPLDVLRLRDSDLSCVEDAEVFRCAVLSWCVSWHQTPAASLPDDDALLARLLGFGRDIKGWKRVRAAGGLRGWVLCEDARLYHPVVAEKALSAWQSKLKRLARIDRRLQIESGLWSTLRASVFTRDDYTCRYCGRRGGKLECDHVVPMSRGGETVESNLVTACRPCNRSKGSKELSEWKH